MKSGFVGCGAIGSCYASRLMKAHEVCVPDTFQPVIDAVKAHGILVDDCLPETGTGETHAFRPAIAATDPMVQDVQRHHETEIRIITGAVCRLGREHGIPTPCNDLLLQLVLAKQSLYLGR